MQDPRYLKKIQDALNFHASPLNQKHPDFYEDAAKVNTPQEIQAGIDNEVNKLIPKKVEDGMSEEESMQLKGFDLLNAVLYKYPSLKEYFSQDSNAPAMALFADLNSGKYKSVDELGESIKKGYLEYIKCRSV